ncbi:MAG: sensor histidine kinase [Gammaproteobacteria bacterium]
MATQTLSIASRISMSNHATGSRRWIRATESRDTLFLPDLSDIRVVLIIVIMGELLAFVIVLSPNRGLSNAWLELAMVSVFVQWVALISALLLSWSRPWLRKLGDVRASVVSFCVVLGVTLLLSEGAYWVLTRQLLVLDPDAQSRGGLIGTMLGALSGQAHAEFVLRNLAIAGIVTTVSLRYFYVQHQWKANLESETRARIQALQSRIRPHFLFNSMNMIASLTRSHPELAEQVTEDLAELFRASLGDASVPVTLDRELDMARQYLRIEAQRLDARLRAHWSIDDLPMNALLPALTLQPLIENAVYHGIEPAHDGGELYVTGWRSKDRVCIELRNTMPPGTPSAEGEGGRHGNQMAQENVRQRLQAFFGGSATMTAGPKNGEYRVALDIPYVRETAQTETGTVRAA